MSVSLTAVHSGREPTALTKAAVSSWTQVTYCATVSVQGAKDWQPGFVQGPASARSQLISFVVQFVSIWASVGELLDAAAKRASHLHVDVALSELAK